MLKIEIKLIVYDFDGVMTDNKAYIDQDGNEMVQVNRADGLGVAERKIWHRPFGGHSPGARR
jgi:3-deoxy-D-manno-octulosonate 8-phosphate phosphatase KdsC-like HAD superfamily phosphatase